MARPYVFVNMAMTLDGKIAAFDRGGRSLGSGADRREMDRLRAEADIVLWGRGTLLAARGSARVRDPGLAAARQASGRPAPPANGGVPASGEIPPSWRGVEGGFFGHRTNRVIHQAHRRRSAKDQDAAWRAGVPSAGILHVGDLGIH
ncbi:MAG: dihydrofolate reductase family protein, partial [Nitrospinota bacterium]